MSENLWGDLSGIHAGPVPPIAILREQAKILAEATKGLVLGSVTPALTPPQIGFMFSLVAPALNNYTVALFQISHEMDLFPVYIFPQRVQITGSTTTIKCANEFIFKQALSRVLGSSHVKSLIMGLVAQSSAMKNR